MTSTPPLPTSTPPLPQKLLTALAVACLIPLIDTSVVNVAIPRVVSDLNVAVDRAGWVVTGYMIATGVGMGISAGLSRYAGLRRTWMGAMVVFTAASLVCGCAPSCDALIAARAVQGLSGGVLTPMVQAIIVAVAGRERMRDALGVIGIPAVAAPAIGPLLGGWLTTSLSWRAVFLINVPLCLVALLLEGRAIPQESHPEISLDIIGGALLAVGLGSGLLGLSWAVEADPRPLLLCTAASILALTVFTVHSRRVSEPILKASLLSHRSIGTTFGLSWCVGATFYAFLFAYPVTAHHTFGTSMTMIGMALGIQGVGAFIGRRLLATSLRTMSSFTLLSGGLIGTALTTLPFSMIDVLGNLWAVSGLFLIRGALLGIVTIVLLGACVENVDPADAPHASALIRIGLQIGGAAGIAATTVMVSLGTTVTFVGISGCAGVGALLAAPSALRSTPRVPAGKP
ncbi:putative multidrug resistance protein MdtD [Austwickia sp. TVS 96-490-7B]|uniref:MFS transporter n=1 Tax=Austwickia sp. TVS 96-490-7B TaxID=2830843 RepID=UPI001C57DD49|nr:MFS transporter [Austwickia sp. TVS 96-490-7B]MBW3084860.1 putative multidrug resistance protein MdtD [Austwickia sp. TVS 96-490-7B]